MPMNAIHRKICNSRRWGRAVSDSIIPWTLDGLDLGGDVLEIGPGFAATTRVLAQRPGRLTALEIDPASAKRLAEELGERARIVEGDGTAMPFPDDSYSGVACFTMLHHVPSPALQDRLFAEAVRVLQPGGTFAGSDSQPSLTMTLIHLRDTLVPVPPETLAQRLTAAGLAEVEVTTRRGRVRFRGVKPG
ncbi:MAG TPA: class I SAM-dependent methyltransferase [Jatrophihabitans sp.]|nr:class I SAM-dependent methyltransferase [Jatrophihabitans sp.]